MQSDCCPGLICPVAGDGIGNCAKGNFGDVPIGSEENDSTEKKIEHAVVSFIQRVTEEKW